ncbi:hypothetical protein [Azospirillum thermophilum]|uniref:Uncharacterized protein n=1 Tax=Azospirillum thermophilum TaxID=2202148 RepID=A0A2S2D0J7_9PROT|nr:hypothetical protein [Azospirillum thermophilum]AWK90286.1 hypothetical protein DEW08_30220 [Azospirillum thermophilum]
MPSSLPPAAGSLPSGFTSLVERFASSEPVVRALAVGSGPGREALARGLARNPRRPVLVDGGAGSLPNAHEVAEAWLRLRDDPDQPPLALLLDRLEEEGRRREGAAGAEPPSTSAGRSAATSRSC